MLPNMTFSTLLGDKSKFRFVLQNYINILYPNKTPILGGGGYYTSRKQSNILTRHQSNVIKSHSRRQWPIPGFFKKGSFVEISCQPGSNNLDKQIYPLIGYNGGRLSSSAKSFSFLYCRKLFTSTTNFWQKILDYFISTVSSQSFPHCEQCFRILRVYLSI